MISDIKALNNFKFEELLYPDRELKTNASIVEHQNKIYCTYRTEDFEDFDNQIYITEFGSNFFPVSHKKLITENENTAFEDIRLFSYNETLLALYTYFPGSKETKWLYYNDAVGIGIVDLETGIIKNQQSFRCYNRRSHEKNWIPFIHNNELYIIADFDPYFRIMKSSGAPGNFLLTEVHYELKQFNGWGYGEIRGGTPFIKHPFINDGYLYGFVHSCIAIHKVGQSREYFYTIARYCPRNNYFEFIPVPIGVWENENYENYNHLKKIGGARNYNSLKCVFPMGIMNYKNGIIMSYGKDDCVSRLKFFDWEYLLKLFDNVN